MSNTSAPIYKIGNYGLHILDCKNGKFSYVGSIPEKLLKPYKNSLGIPGLKSMVFDSYDEAFNYAKQTLQF